jgi:hypothetical protein
MITFYQGFIFSVLADHDVIKGESSGFGSLGSARRSLSCLFSHTLISRSLTATEFWTATNVADGLQALCTCCEMVGFSALFLWAFSWKPYKAMRPDKAPSTSVFWAVLDSLNYCAFGSLSLSLARSPSLTFPNFNSRLPRRRLPRHRLHHPLHPQQTGNPLEALHHPSNLPWPRPLPRARREGFGGLPETDDDAEDEDVGISGRCWGTGGDADSCVGVWEEEEWGE